MRFRETSHLARREKDRSSTRGGRNRRTRARLYHFAAKVRADGAVSALCFKKPRGIDLSRACWTNQPSVVTCPKCATILELSSAIGKALEAGDA